MRKSWKKTDSGFVRVDGAFEIIIVAPGLYELFDIGGFIPFFVESSTNLSKLKKDWDMNWK